ncbi:MAG: YraN family protein [Rickettsiales bacterium]|nr:YraN family protein [Rickettsiales bacterium]
MVISTYKLGVFSEYLAVLILRLKKYIILHQRYRNYLGEIDIIARKANLIIFVEVKTIKERNKNFPIVSNKQINRIKKSSMLYLSQNNYYNHCNIRFDLITVHNLICVRHYKNIF